MIIKLPVIFSFSGLIDCTFVKLEKVIFHSFELYEEGFALADTLYSPIPPVATTLTGEVFVIFPDFLFL